MILGHVAMALLYCLLVALGVVNKVLFRIVLASVGHYVKRSLKRPKLGIPLLLVGHCVGQGDQVTFVQQMLRLVVKAVTAAVSISGWSI
mmetsp:Transcript_43538/g.121022  ORF Transcript_43538/g.121022 Transcript_43538/m.121022 type:complete len:89 (+) Transcript_43538:1208-1474(+)